MIVNDWVFGCVSEVFALRCYLHTCTPLFYFLMFYYIIIFGRGEVPQE